MVMPKALMVTVGAIFMTLFVILFGWILFPAIIRHQLRKEMALSMKTDVREMWETLPFAMDFKVYLFNYTNPEVVQQGGIPIVEEIGPYYFENWKKKVEIEDDPETDTVSYQNFDTYYFRPGLSGPGLTGEEILTMPHLFMLGMALTVAREKPPMLPVISKALKGLFDQPKDVFLRVKAIDILFHGMIINCARKEFAPKTVCIHLKKQGARGLVLEANDQLRFSIFGMRNNTADPRVITVKRGIKKVQDVGLMVAIDGEPEQDIWRDECNKMVGTDLTVFPPFMKQTERVEAFYLNLCRPFRAWYINRTRYGDIRTYHYYVNLGDLANDPELQCLCEAPDKCPPKGLMDMFNCLKAPLYASLPHFLDCDPKIQEKVKGLTPDSDIHGIHIDFEPLTGTPMEARLRMQFNIQMYQNDNMYLFQNLSNDIVPVFWLEEGLALNKTYENMLNHQLFIPIRIVKIGRVLLVIFGVVVVIASVAFHNKEEIIGTLLAIDSKVVPVKKEDKKREEQAKNISTIGEPAKIDM